MSAIVDSLPPSSRVLEAGAGSCVVAAHLRTAGHDVTGVDFAGSALSAAKRAWPDLSLVTGRLDALPFRDSAFDAIVSLGALEHLVEGFSPALEEHRRVLRPGGLLLITLPFTSVAKNVNDARDLVLRRRPARVSGRGRTVERSNSPSNAAFPPDRSFVQYEYPARWIRRTIAAGGFDVVSSLPTVLSAGVGELRSSSSAAASDHSASTAPAGANGNSAQPGSALRRHASRIIRERPSGVIDRVLLALARPIVGHMLLVVARRI